jgi:hypothetical protein
MEETKTKKESNGGGNSRNRRKWRRRNLKRNNPAILQKSTGRKPRIPSKRRH